MSIYSPGIPPLDPKDLPAFLSQELNRVARAKNEADEFLALTPLAVEPVKRFDGMIVMADGTNWNPGAGVGYYGYHSNTWNKLG